MKSSKDKRTKTPGVSSGKLAPADRSSDRYTSRRGTKDSSSDPRSQKPGKVQHSCAVKPVGAYSSPSSLAVPKQRTRTPLQRAPLTTTVTGKQRNVTPSATKLILTTAVNSETTKEAAKKQVQYDAPTTSQALDENRRVSQEFTIYEDPHTVSFVDVKDTSYQSPSPRSSPPFAPQLGPVFGGSGSEDSGEEFWCQGGIPFREGHQIPVNTSAGPAYESSYSDGASIEETPAVPTDIVYRVPNGVNVLDVDGHIIDLQSIPRPLTIFDEDHVEKIYSQLNFDHQSVDPVIEVADVFLPRDINFNKLLGDDRSDWFIPACSCEPQALRQTWRNCGQDDARIIRDLYCAYNLTLHNTLEMVKTIKFTKSGGTPLQGWLDVWIDPNDLITDFCANLPCSPVQVDRIWNDYGIDLFRFIETQYTLRTAIYSFMPEAIEIRPGTRNEGRNMYLLTCMMQENGKFKLRQYPPQILITPSHSPQKLDNEITILPGIWHPHFSVSKGHSIPHYTVVGDASWLLWNPDRNQFQGKIPGRKELETSSKVDAEGRICISIVAGYALSLGSSTPELHEVITSRFYITVQEKQETIEQVNKEYFPPNPLDFLWLSYRLGFDKTHSSYLLQRSRYLERRLRENFNDADARAYAEFNKIRLRDPPLLVKSRGPISWDEFLRVQCLRSQYMNQRDELTMKMKEEEHLLEKTCINDSEFEDSDPVEADFELEKMRAQYENQFHEAESLVWLWTTYRDTFQDRMEDEACDEFE